MGVQATYRVQCDTCDQYLRHCGCSGDEKGNCPGYQRVLLPQTATAYTSRYDATAAARDAGWMNHLKCNCEPIFIDAQNTLHEPACGVNALASTLCEECGG